ncbi:hypothetical protein QOZ80_2AG0149840 [Eleusine coracana subsp. coracana]|nr:hypothetical protein QOZ80_2AG0149840 [Eleusine coracana subsp. coracana]
MKGLLKGLRYISQIFDAKEPEMKIGNPTDVKHVAHIGWDNASSVTTPAWMQDFKASPGPSRGGEPEPSQPRGGGGGGEGEPGEGGAGGRAEKTERPRRTKGKASGASEAKRRDGASEGSRRDRRMAKAEAEGSEGDAAAAPKQQRRKPRGGGTSSGGRSKSSSGSAGCGPASDSEAARPAAEDDRNGC